MEIRNVADVEARKIETFPYIGKPLEVKEVWIQWLSQAGSDMEAPDYGLRFFRVGPGGVIPIHNHFYHQTMYILSGECECYRYDPGTEQRRETCVAGPGDYIYIPGMEAHGMKNVGSEAVTFLCCIANVYEDK